jgi:hypothetical protein
LVDIYQLQGLVNMEEITWFLEAAIRCDLSEFGANQVKQRDFERETGPFVNVFMALYVSAPSLKYKGGSRNPLYS